ncbi:hypothetical protein PoB_007081300 [Plakobranchus ocellatus]|uniref:Uncharacterized protein n=1 Tax=Plakobranchus ocellatus TaxID=259542 RepID=A0AAV4DJ95_9GAST|nr:hypothetical protein PoB_007081300 [Plakobranchus ocellatus]
MLGLTMRVRQTSDTGQPVSPGSSGSFLILHVAAQTVLDTVRVSETLWSIPEVSGATRHGACSLAAFIFFLLLPFSPLCSNATIHIHITLSSWPDLSMVTLTTPGNS